MTPPGYGFLKIAAFIARKISGKLVPSRGTNKRGNMYNNAVLSAADAIMQRVLPNERQSAEWGINALKGTFGVLSLPITPNSCQRYKLLCTCARLLNLCTGLVGLNQIRTDYADEEADSQPWVRLLVGERAVVYKALST